MLPPDPYAAIADVYDSWRSRGPFWRHVFPWLSQRLRPARSYLDIGCGTAELLLTLRALRPSHDLALVGYDRSPSMLAVARAKAINLDIALVEAPPAGLGADVAGAFHDVVNHVSPEQIHTPASVTLAPFFASAWSSLRASGTFFFDANTADSFKRWHGGHHFQAKGLHVTVYLDWNEHLGLATANIEVIPTDSNIAPRTTSISERLFDEEEIRAAASTAGFLVASVEPWLLGKRLWTVARNG